MAKFGKSAQRSVKRAMHKLKEGSLKGGKNGKPVKSKKQAIAMDFQRPGPKGQRCLPNKIVAVVPRYDRIEYEFTR